MIKRTEREPIVRWIDDAVAAGARRRAACSLLGVSTRTLERWRGAGTLREDGVARGYRWRVISSAMPNALRY